MRTLRDHLLGAVDEDLQISLDGQPYVVAWADRRPAEFDAPYFDITSAMRVVEREHRSAEVVGTGEEQITLVIDGERFIFHLVEVSDEPAGRGACRRVDAPRFGGRGTGSATARVQASGQSPEQFQMSLADRPAYPVQNRAPRSPSPSAPSRSRPDWDSPRSARARGRTRP